MIITEIIEKKRDGQVLKPEEIDFMINGLVNGEVADYQMTSFMMAVCCRGMNETETAALTKAMIDSGNTIDLSDVPGIKVDKHSTGGVGDTTTLVVAPLVAACGGTVAKCPAEGLPTPEALSTNLNQFPEFVLNSRLNDSNRLFAISVFVLSVNLPISILRIKGCMRCVMSAER